MDLFELFGTIAIKNAEAHKAMDETIRRAQDANKTMEKSLEAEVEIDAREAVANLRDTEEQVQQTSASMNTAEENTEDYTSALEKLTQKVDSQRKALAELKTKYNDTVYSQGKTSKESRNLAKKIKELSSELKENENKLTEANKAADKFDDSLEEAAKTSEKTESRMSSAFKKIGAAVAAAFAVDKIKDFSVSCIEATANAEAMESQFSQVFGSLESQAAGNLTSIADNTGIVENRLKSSYTQIAAFAKASGMDTGAALSLASRAMIAVADSAAFYDRSLEDTTDSLQSFLKGNYENDAALGLSATEATRDAKAMELYGSAFKDLSESQKQLTLLQMVEDANKLSGAMGQASRESDTWSNQTGNLRQAWTDFQAAVGGNFLGPAITGVKKLTEFVQKLEKPAQRFIDMIKEKGTPFLDKIIQAIEDIKDGWNAAEPALKTGLWEGFLKPIAEWSYDNALIGVEKLGKLCKTLGESTTEEDVKVLIDLAGAIAGIYLSAKGYKIAGKIDAEIPKVKQSIKKLGTTAELSFSNVALGIGSAIAGWQIGSMIYDAVGTEIDETLWPFFDAWLLGFDMIKTGIGDLLNTWSVGADEIGNICQRIIQGVRNIWDFWVGYGEYLYDWWHSLPQNIKQKLTDIKTGFDNWLTDLKTGASEKLTQLTSTVSDKFDSIKTKVKEKIDAAKDHVKNTIDKIKDFFDFEWSLPNIKLPHFSIVGNFSLNPPEVPTLSVDWYAKGGILNAPTLFDYNPASGRFKGGGEAGAEAVAPIDVLLGYIRTAVGEQNAGILAVLQRIEQHFPEILRSMQRNVVLSTGETVGALTPYINEELGAIQKLEGR